MNSARGYISYFFKFAVAAAILFWLFQSGKIDLSAFMLVLRPSTLLIAVGLLGFGYYLTALRWRWLLASQGVPLSRGAAFRLSLIGVFFSFALPGGVTGDVVKAYYIARGETAKRLVAGISVIIDRFVGVTVMALLSLFTMLVDLAHVWSVPALRAIFVTISLLSAGLLLAGALLFSPRFHASGFWRHLTQRVWFGERLRQLFAAGHAYGTRRGALLKAGAVSVLSQCCSILMLVYCGEAIGADLTWSTYFYCVPLGMMLAAIPIAPGGIGVGQAAFYFLFNLRTGTVSEIGPTLATLYQVFGLGFGLVGAFFYLKNKEVSYAGKSAA